MRDALVQIVLRLRDYVLRDRDAPHGAPSTDLFSGGPRITATDSLYSSSSRSAPAADSFYSSTFRSAPVADSLYSGSLSVPSALSGIPPVTPLSYEQRVETGSGMGMLPASSLYRYGSLQVLYIQQYTHPHIISLNCALVVLSSINNVQKPYQLNEIYH